MTHVLHTVRLSDVESVFCGERERKHILKELRHDILSRFLCLAE